MAELTQGMLPPAIAQAVQVIDDGSIQYQQFKLTRVGMQIQGDITLDDWRKAGVFLRQVRGWLNYWIGDWLNAFHGDWGEMYTEAAAITGMTIETLTNVASVCGKVEFSLRNENLHWSHTVAVSPLPPEKQREYIKIAVEQKLSVARLRKLIAGPEIIPKPEQPEIVNKKHRTVFKRLWKGVESLDPANVSREDITHIRKWLAEVEQALDEASQ